MTGALTPLHDFVAGRAVVLCSETVRKEARFARPTPSPARKAGRGALPLLWLALVSASAAPQPVALDLITGATLPARLSDFRFFVGGKPNARVHGYALNTPLFSDYAVKDRYVFVPPRQTARYADDGVFDFPVGSAFIKSFGYGGAHPVETRVLLRRASGWVALPYVWEGNDAVLKRAGTRVDVTVNGQPVSYKVPNANQCKECHALDGSITLIGPKARNLNDGAQLAAWVKAGLLDRAPADAPRVPRFDDETAPVALRARAYLDVNCGHCHNPRGAASNSGLVLSWGETNPTALGIGKTPVAAGRGSGGRYFAIAPGDPDRSIMIYRLKSVEPGVAMPELGRATVHAEGVALLERWIREMPKQ